MGVVYYAAGDDELYWRTFGGSVHLSVVCVGLRLDEGDPVVLVLRDVMELSRDYCTIVSLRLTVGLRMVC